MSKRKRKSRSDTSGYDFNGENINNSRNNMNNRQTYNNPFGINPNQLLNAMFGNIDMSQISNLIQSMNTQGFDFNKLNLGNLMENMNYATNTNNINNDWNMDISSANEEDSFLSNIERNDENINMLRAIKSIVSEERQRFIDKIISMYNSGAFDD